jgi:hypothetical protein
MLKQDPLPTHDGRQGQRGSIVNIASQLALVSRPEAGTQFLLGTQLIATLNVLQLHIVHPKLQWFRSPRVMLLM